MDQLIWVRDALTIKRYRDFISIQLNSILRSNAPTEEEKIMTRKNQFVKFAANFYKLEVIKKQFEQDMNFGFGDFDDDNDQSNNNNSNNNNNDNNNKESEHQEITDYNQNNQEQEIYSIHREKEEQFEAEQVHIDRIKDHQINQNEQQQQQQEYQQVIETNYQQIELNNNNNEEEIKQLDIGRQKHTSDYEMQQKFNPIKRQYQTLGGIENSDFKNSFGFLDENSAFDVIIQKIGMFKLQIRDGKIKLLENKAMLYSKKGKRNWKEIEIRSDAEFQTREQFMEQKQKSYSKKLDWNQSSVSKYSKRFLMKKKLSKGKKKSNYLAIYFDDNSLWDFLTQLFKHSPATENVEEPLENNSSQDHNHEEYNNNNYNALNTEQNEPHLSNQSMHSLSKSNNQEPNSELDHAMVERNDDEQEQEEILQNSNLIDNELKQRINEQQLLEPLEILEEEQQQQQQEEDEDEQLGGLMQYLPGEATNKQNHDDINFEPDDSDQDYQQQQEQQEQQPPSIKDPYDLELSPREFEVSPLKQDNIIPINSEELLQPQLFQNPRVMIDEKLRKSYTQVHQELQSLFKKEEFVKKKQIMKEEEEEGEISIEISMGNDDEAEKEQEQLKENNNPNIQENQEKQIKEEIEEKKDKEDSVNKIQQVQLRDHTSEPNSVLINERKNSQHFKKDNAINQKSESCAMCNIF